MRIAVFGAGGIGGYLGAKLAQAGEDVVILAGGRICRPSRPTAWLWKAPLGIFS